jgi:hypothetical protein
VATLALGLKNNTQLCVLDLQFNCVGDAGVPGLCSAIIQNKSLEVLNLSYCQITAKPAPKGKGATSAMQALRKLVAQAHPNFTNLELNGNVLGERPVDILLDALSKRVDAGADSAPLGNQEDDTGTHKKELVLGLEGCRSLKYAVERDYSKRCV